MKRLLLAAALALLPIAASAQDLTRRAPAPTSGSSAPVWTGFYAGLSAGYAWGKHRTRYYANGALAGDHGSDDINGGLIGGAVGYNHQIGSLVIGVEGDLSISGLRGSSSGVSGDECLRWDGANFVIPGGYCRTDVNWLGSARVRGGAAVGPALLYFTGGLAFGEVEANRPFTGVANNWSQTRTGWTVGAGVEYAVAPAWSVKAEYLYVDLGNDLTYPCPACTTKNHRVDVNTHLVRVGFNYRFGAAAPGRR